ncbi:SspB-related isopeptide-forming adhesin [Ligilactobacillus salivarius]|uniref:SspB-related isopeptide-forming adhesin n=3 Tax=Ligilactobacillus salivarius TaxID=1624 RepID=UPI0006651FFC|nr:SspB-related isopeptide-forming adhesin [Ligilactobacillus salivarius]OQR18409.1 hypothetical protein B6U40_09775 [Ligilactobacillus salivarius]
MTETKLHYKLYKTKHGWVTATIAATALAIPIISGSVTNHASADTTATTGTQTVTSGSNAVTATTASATSATSNTQSVTPDSSKLDQAVQNAKSTANVTVNQTPTQTVTGSTVAEAKQQAEQDYSSQAATINQKVANQKANNDATNAANSFNMDNAKKRELDQAVQNAKSTANVTVNQTQTQIYNTNASGVENTKNKINNDYSTQINNINQAVSAQKAKNDAYNKAVAEANTLNKSTADTTRKNLDDAIKVAQAVKGVTLIDDGTSTSTVSVSDFEAKKKQIQDQNTQQANSINAQIQQYKQKLDEYNKTLNSDQINPDLIKQELILGSEKDAELSYRLLSKDVDASYDKWSGGTVGRDNYKHTVMVTAHNRGSLIGDIIEVTYTNLNKSSYNGKKISKIIATFSNVTQDNLSPYNISFAIYSNPYYGFWYWQSSKITVNYKFYDENNHLISFDNADNSWITIGSLNSGKGRYESAKLNSSGKVYGFKDSSVTIHNGNTLYSDKANDSGSRIGDNWQNTYPSDVTSNYPWGTNDWDKGLDDPHAYYGAGIFKVNGNDLNVTYGTRRAVFVNPGTWATISTSIPKGSGPVTPTIHYKHTNVALEKPTPTEVTYHYDTIMPATIPGGTPISYHYNEISVPIPNPTKVDKNEKGVNIDGKNVLPGSVNNYELTMDLSKFKGIKVTDQDLAKGFYFVDDYPEKALDVDPQTFTSKTVDGKTVKGLSAKVYQSLSEVPSDVAAVLKANNITPKGAFVLISADDPAQFFKDYVETGTNITVNAPMKVKAGFAGKYENKAWQLTFGQGEATDIVSNNVPKIDPKKDIVISADNRTSLNNHTIELGQNFDYLLKGGILDKDQGHDIYEYKWIDDYDQNHDQYNGQFIAPLTVDVALKDGTVLKAGTDISNHVSQNIDTKTGSVEFSVDKDFLDKVDFDKGGFAADILMSVKKIKAGEVDNTYTNIINGQKFGSNTVHSTTPEPKTPETPATPQTPTTTPSASVTTPQTPATPQPVKMVTSTPSKAPESPALPQMGETNDTLAEEVVGFAAIVAVLGMAGTSLKKRKD